MTILRAFAIALVLGGAVQLVAPAPADLERGTPLTADGGSSVGNGLTQGAGIQTARVRIRTGNVE